MRKNTNKEKKNQENEEESIELSKKGNPRLHPEYKSPILINKQLDSI